MTKTLSNGESQKYHLIANEAFLVFLTSRLIHTLLTVSLQKAKPKVQTFGHELSRPLDLDGHSVKPPKVEPKVQTQRSMPLYSLLKITPPI
jgi:hypothetical protein